MRVRDLIYFDANKASSIWSQINQGINESVTTTIHQESGSRVGGKIGVQGIGAEGKKYSTEKGTTTEILIPHHELLSQLEDALECGGLVSDTADLLNSETDIHNARSSVAKKPYVRASGLVVFEDYPRLQAMAEDFSRLRDFLNRCSLLNDDPDESVIAELNKIDLCYRELNIAFDDKERSKLEKKIANLQTSLESLSGVSVESNPEWLFRGISEWIEKFAPNRRIARLTNAGSAGELEFVGSLKLDCFVDQDLDHMLFAYGERPSELITIFGLVTNIPVPNIDPDSIESGESVLESDQTMVSAFENIFESMTGVYETMNPVYFPRMAVHPIALYRDIRSDI